jgi:hypothetical protein
MLMEWTGQCSSTVLLLINSWTTFEIRIFSFSWQEMLFTSTLFQTYVKKSNFLYMKQQQVPVISAIVFPLNCTTFSLISFLIYLYITSFIVFIFCIFYIAAIFRISCSCSPIKYVSPTIMYQ